MVQTVRQIELFDLINNFFVKDEKSDLLKIWVIEARKSIEDYYCYSEGLNDESIMKKCKQQESSLLLFMQDFYNDSPVINTSDDQETILGNQMVINDNDIFLDLCIRGLREETNNNFREIGFYFVEFELFLLIHFDYSILVFYLENNDKEDIIMQTIKKYKLNYHAL